jgi:hypothetical protein
VLKRRKEQAAEMFSRILSFGDLEKRVSSEDKSRKIPGALFAFLSKPSLVAGFLIVIAVGISLKMFAPKKLDWETKGGGNGYCVVKRGATILKVDTLFTVHVNDTLQIFHTSIKEPWIMVLYDENRNGFKNCTQLDTAMKMESSPIASAIPFSIVIDSSKGLLECALIASNKKFTFKDASEALRGKWEKKYTIHLYRVIRE